MFLASTERENIKRETIRSTEMKKLRNFVNLYSLILVDSSLSVKRAQPLDKVVGERSWPWEKPSAEVFEKLEADETPRPQ